MNSTLPIFAALIPMALGPVPSDHENALIVSLCNGGTIAIPLNDGDGQDQRDCDTKACHAGTCRKLSNKDTRGTAS